MFVTLAILLVKLIFIIKKIFEQVLRVRTMPALYK